MQELWMHIVCYRRFKHHKCLSPSQKSHTCEEGGAHLRNSFWLFIDELEKLLRKLLKWANKKCKNLKISKKKEKKRKAPGDINNTLHLCAINIKDMI